MEVVSRLWLFVGCLAVALTAGWAFGWIAGVVDPELAGPVAGFEHLNDTPGHANAPLVAPQETP